MKKRMSLCLLAFAAALLLSACGAPDAAESTSPSSPAAAEEAVIAINGETIPLTYETNHYDLYYKENVARMQRDTMGTFRNEAYYNEQGEQIFAIHLVYYEGKTAEQVIEASDYELTPVTVGGLDYLRFAYTEDGRAGHTYVHEHNGDAYTISFVSDYDMTQLEDAFLSTVSFR